MKAIIGTFVMLLLASGVFAISMPSYEYEAGQVEVSPVSVATVSEIVTGDIDAEEVSDILADLNRVQSSSLKRFGFVNVWRGNGWVENGQEGRLVQAIWAVQKYATVDSLSDSSETEYTTYRTFGRIHISGDKIYKLVRYANENDEKHVNFYVVPLKVRTDSEDIEEYAVGKLSVTMEENMGDFSTWTGTLKMDSDTLSGYGDVKLGVIFKKIRGNSISARARGIQEIGTETVVSNIIKPSKEGGVGSDEEVVGIGRESGYEDRDYSGEDYDSEDRPPYGAERVKTQKIDVDRVEVKNAQKSFWSFLKFW